MTSRTRQMEVEFLPSIEKRVSLRRQALSLVHSLNGINELFRSIDERCYLPRVVEMIDV